MNVGSSNARNEEGDVRARDAHLALSCGRHDAPQHTQRYSDTPRQLTLRLASIDYAGRHGRHVTGYLGVSMYYEVVSGEKTSNGR